MKRALLLAAGLAVLSAPALADSTLNFELRDLKKKDVSTSTQVCRISGHNLAVDVTGAEQARMIFLGDKQTIYIINDKDKNYMLLDKAGMEAMAAQIDEASAMLQAQLAKLPPEQRAMMEKNMAKMMGGAAARTHEYVSASETKSINGFGCHRVDIMTDEVKTGESWNAAIDALKVPASDYQIYRDFMAMLDPLVKSSRQMLGGLNLGGGEDHKGGKGPAEFSVLTRFLDGEKVRSEVELKSIDHAAVDASAFQLPEGYKQKDFPKVK